MAIYSHVPTLAQYQAFLFENAEIHLKKKISKCADLLIFSPAHAVSLRFLALSQGSSDVTS